MGLLGLLHSAFFGNQALQELKMTSSVAPYEQLVRQVEALKAENSHLRQELRDNSSHLCKLETETSGMKEVLKHLQGKLEQEARVLVSSGQTEVLEQLKALQMDISSLYNLTFQPLALEPEPAACTGTVTATATATAEGSPVHGSAPSKDSFGELGRATIRLLEELDQERCFLLSEMEKEEQEKLWYYAQLQGLAKRLDELPHVETMDLIRQQLEFEAQHIRSLMEERFGTSDERVQRAQMRASRLEQIDKELLSAQDRVQQTEPQALLAVKPIPVDEEPEPEAPTQPEDGALQPGNSKVEVVFWLLSMLATRDQEDTARTLLAMSSSPESCVAMRRSGCLPLLLQILHGAEAGVGGGPGAPGAKDARMRANAALHNIVFSQPEQGLARKEMRVLHVLEQIRAYCETCGDWLRARPVVPDQAPAPIEPQICQATCAVMKLSFDEEYRRAMNELGGLQAVAELLQVDYEMYRMTRDPLNLALRRYAGMTLTNLTFGDVANKAMLCGRRGCMEAIVAQLGSESEELQQVVSSILRNLSWRADIHSKKVLREVGSMAALMDCALRASKESTLKSVLSALWNLSAHSTENKAALCQVQGALGFLVSTLTYKCASNSLAIIESGGGVLRNVSSLVATREDYRQVLRDHNCLQTLLQHLTSHSLTIVSNACGTLWNLSARSARDQELLWELGAVGMLRNLVHSKHKMIAMGSAAALRNLLAHRPAKYAAAAAAVSPGSCAPSLVARKQRALEAELDTRGLAQALGRLDARGLAEPDAKKSGPPLRHLDALARDYASDSGCFDDEDAPSLAAAAEPASPAVPPPPLLPGGPRPPTARRGAPDAAEPGPADAAVAARAKAKLALAVARIDRLVEDIAALHTSSEDSLSLSSGDPGREAAREARAQSCSPCRGRAPPLLRLQAAHASLSNDSLNSGSASASDPPPRLLAALAERREAAPGAQARPSRLDLSAKGALDARVRTIKLSPTYQHVPMADGAAPTQPGVRRQAWPAAEGPSRAREKAAAGALELSRYSSLSSLSSAGRPGPSETGDVEDSDSSLERLEEARLDAAWHGPGPAPAASLPVAIPGPLHARGPGPEDATPSSSSENCVQETPLVLSRCSSVSSLGSFESPSIASSFASEPCSGLGSGAVSPSELPDSPGQTMPPSRSKTPPAAAAPFSLQWESYVKRFLDIADCRERRRLPSELDAGSVRFTLEQPDENFSCASSLSALALHEHYVQQDVELRLLRGAPGPHPHAPRRREEAPGRPAAPPPALAAPTELQLLRDCLGATPARLRKVASALVPGRARALPLPVYMLVAAPPGEDNLGTDSAEGAASLSDETLRGPRPAPKAAASTKQASGNRHRAGARGQEPPHGTGRDRKELELPLGPGPSSASAPRAHGDGGAQPLCLTTPTEEAVYCFYDDDSEDEPAISAAPPRRASAIPRAVKRDRAQPPGREPPTARSQPSLIEDETPPCYSLSSSASSLSEPEPPRRPRARPPAAPAAEARAPASRAPPDLPRRCAASALPRRRMPAAGPRRSKPRAARPEDVADEAAGSDRASDLDSVQWRAIQEGANSIVTWLHQAAAATREASSESDSLRSSASALSAGSTLQASPHHKAHRPDARAAAATQRAAGAPKGASGLPSVRRGRTVIYVPRPVAPKAAPGARSAPRKSTQPAATPKAPASWQPRSRSLHRPGLTTEPAAPRPTQRSATPPARLAKTPSSGSSQTSPAARPPPPGPRRPAPAHPTPGPAASPVPQTPARALLARQHKTQKSPVRIPFMARPAGRGPPPLARPSPEPGPRGRPGLLRGASARSSGSESSERSGFRRQLTFIKESPGLPRRRHPEQGPTAAAPAPVPVPVHASPRRGRPALPAVFLCSSRCDELRAPPRPGSAPAPRPRPGLRERPPRRPSSESPSRLPLRTAAPRPDTVRRYASLPHISVARRPAAPAAPAAATPARRSSDGEPSPASTWRRIRDEDVPHILQRTLPACALPLRRTSDAVVQTEDPAARAHAGPAPSPESRVPVAPAPVKPPADGPGFPASRHGSPSRSARVSPFNYVPSPMAAAGADPAAQKLPAGLPE
ncbi:adenomatous polyposis coli protein 2 isoform X2 [Erinaceus europaeus]|uniref:Adenomatous polyposis coli protein 2 isoform X2 n=1 Tax=Erinaceus europaeus TaxID=9365 RepID=A0ABM3WMS2_ERIEU|nr:adenomatous polyposis coli protein 2 isoform X2 [Erinaceus europaeus]